MSVSAYPLQWPAMRPRQILRSPSRFDRKRTIAAARDGLLEELRMLGAKNVVVSTNMRVRLDGLLASGQAQPKDPAVAVWFSLDGEPMCLACDWWDQVQCNLWAVAQYVEATRAQLRNGVASARDAFAGFKALPPGDDVPHWRRVLGLPDSGPVTREQVVDAYREKARTAHPDRGGSNEDMAALNVARDAALEEVARG